MAKHGTIGNASKNDIAHKKSGQHRFSPLAEAVAKNGGDRKSDQVDQKKSGQLDFSPLAEVDVKRGGDRKSNGHDVTLKLEDQARPKKDRSHDATEFS